MRNTKLTPETRDAVIEAIEAGNTNKTAAALAGISEATLYNWLAKGKDEEPPEGLEELPTKELRAQARKMKIKGASKLRRDDLLDAILKAHCIHADFLERFELATATAHAKHVQNITQAALDDWKASAWYLERRDPENWGKRDRVQADVNHSGGIKTEHEESYKLELETKLAQDPLAQELMIQLYERQQIASSGDE